MARPLRLEFSGALYHLTARGNARQKIFFDTEDRQGFLDLLGKEISQQGWVCYGCVSRHVAGICASSFTTIATNAGGH